MDGDTALALEPTENTILVVDDVEANRELLCRRFAKKGFKVIGVDGGEAALARVAEEPIDLIVLDINMPDMSGFDVLRRLRKTKTSAELPIIMATARAQSESVVEALRLGANDYVTKPIDFPVLHARVLATLQTTRASRPSTSPGLIGPGSVLGGRYRLDHRIGAGAFGQVFKGTQLELKRDVAVKVLKVPEESDDALARFRREGITACRVRHPNAVAVFDSGVTEDGTAFLVMELLEGTTLEEELRSRPMPPRKCLEFMASICDALQAAHEQDIVHRDVKPANIFLHRGVPKLLDFGLAKLISGYAMEQKITMDGWMVGTPLYMAPERFVGQPFCGRSDVYSVGIILYQMLASATPFQDGISSQDPVALAVTHSQTTPTPIRQLVPTLPQRLEELLLKVLAKQASERPSAQALAKELRDLAGVLPMEDAQHTSDEKALDSSPTISLEPLEGNEARKRAKPTVNLGAPSKKPK